MAHLLSMILPRMVTATSKSIATMKKMIKNLMLVAVAAMAFVACSEVSVEVDNLTKKTIITGVATIDTDDTRSGFVSSETVENEDGTTSTVYKSAWDGGEEIKIFYDSQETTTNIDDEGKGKFNVEFDGELPTNYYITVCSPAKAWVSAYTCNIPAEQTPRTDSVDPAAHILQCQNAMVTNGTVNAKMQHMVGYGKMTVNTPAEFVIDYVEIKLNGDWYGYAKNLSYTINADNVKDNVFWFATDGIAVSDFTVKAYDAEGNAYTKSVTIPEGRKLEFNYGRVSTFSVSNLESFEKPEAPIFTRAEEAHLYDDNDRMIAFYTDNDDLLVLDLCFVFAGNSILPGTYTHGYKDTGYIYTSGYSYYSPNTTEETDPKYLIYGGEMVVSVVNGEYFIEFKNLTDDASTIILEYASFTGMIDGYTLPDTREKLPTPVVNTPTVNGKEITLTWSKVNGADSYYVYCTQDSAINTTTTELTATFTMPAYETAYGFYIKAIANDDNPTYRSSDETYFQTVSTGSDPDKFADYIMDSIVWDSDSSYFKLTNSGNYPSYVRLFFNESDRPGNNSIKVNQYTGCGSQTPNETQFGARVGWDSFTIDSYTTFSSSATVDVSFENNEYKIILKYANGTTIGYKGMPEGWVAPSGGEGGGEEPTTVNVSLNSIEHYYYNGAYYYHEFQFSDGSNANVLRAAFDLTYCSEASINAGTYTHKGLSSLYPGTNYNITYLCIDGQVISGFNAGDMTITVDGNNYTISVQITSGTTTYNVSLNGTLG